MKSNKVNLLWVNLLLVLLLTGCKIQLQSPDNGRIVTESGSFGCSARNNCEIDVYDALFDEIFHVEAQEGYIFKGWVKRSKGLCGGSSSPCHLFTTSFADNLKLLALLASDEEYYLEAETVAVPDGWQPISDALIGIADDDLRACIEGASKYLDYTEQLNSLTCKEETSDITYIPSWQVQTFAGIASFSTLKELTVFVAMDVDLSALSSLTGLTKLHLQTDPSASKVISLDFLQGLNQLTSLEIRSFAALELGFIGDLTRLKHLNLERNYIANFGHLQNLVNLESLNLTRNFLPSIELLKPLTKLTRLSLIYNDLEDDDIQGLGQFTGLTELKLTGNFIQDISHLAGLTKLETFSASRTQITDISVVSNFPRLHTFWMMRNIVSDFSPIADLLQLSHLYLSGDSIEQIEVLRSTPNLEKLSLGFTQGFDPSVISSLNKLKYLDIYDSQITDLSFLTGTPELETLLLRNNNILDISRIRGLSSLTRLDLSSNANYEINSELNLSPLTKLKSLENLSLAKNGITDISPISGLVNLQYLNLDYNEIEAFNGGLDGMLSGYVSFINNPMLCNDIDEYRKNALVYIYSEGCQIVY